MKVVKNREKPRPKRAARTPEMRSANGPGQAILDQIVGGVAIPQQRRRVAPQMRYLCNNLAFDVAHRKP